MADNDDDDEFGLDSCLLDALPDNALEQLERDAFRATQRQPDVKSRPPNRHAVEYQHRQPLQPRNQESFGSDRTIQPNRPPSDYGFDDEDVIDLDEQPYSVQQGYSQAPNYSRLAGQEAQLQRNHVDEDSFMTAAEHPPVNVTELQERVLQVRSCFRSLAPVSLPLLQGSRTLTDPA
jgi:hypothetical protein